MFDWYEGEVDKKMIRLIGRLRRELLSVEEEVSSLEGTLIFERMGVERELRLTAELKLANEKINKAIAYLNPDLAIPSEPGRALAVLKGTADVR